MAVVLLGALLAICLVASGQVLQQSTNATVNTTDATNVSLVLNGTLQHDHNETLSEAPITVNQSVNATVTITEDSVVVNATFERDLERYHEHALRPQEVVGAVTDLVEHVSSTVFWTYEWTMDFCDQVVWQLGKFTCARPI